MSEGLGKAEQSPVDEADSDTQGESHRDASPSQVRGQRAAQEHDDQARAGEGDLQVEVYQVALHVAPAAPYVLYQLVEFAVAHLLGTFLPSQEVLRRFGPSVGFQLGERDVFGQAASDPEPPFHPVKKQPAPVRPDGAFRREHAGDGAVGVEFGDVDPRALRAASVEHAHVDLAPSPAP